MGFEMTDYRAEQVEIFEELRDGIQSDESLSEPEREKQILELELRLVQMEESWNKEDLQNGKDVSRDYIGHD